MAEYKTYICDICKKQESHRILFLVVLDGDGKEYQYADLCPTHLKVQFQKIVSELSISAQRDLWKRLVNGTK